MESPLQLHSRRKPKNMACLLKHDLARVESALQLHITSGKKEKKNQTWQQHQHQAFFFERDILRSSGALCPFFPATKNESNEARVTSRAQFARPADSPMQCPLRAVLRAHCGESWAAQLLAQLGLQRQRLRPAMGGWLMEVEDVL